MDSAEGDAEGSRRSLSKQGMFRYPWQFVESFVPNMLPTGRQLQTRPQNRIAATALSRRERHSPEAGSASPADWDLDNCEGKQDPSDDGEREDHTQHARQPARAAG